MKKTQTEIFETIEDLLPEKLYKKFAHLSFAEMAEEEALAEWADELRQAENDWFAAAE